ncbi:UNVERIFIED_CONTAM: Protein BIC1 [Sesamum indicum]
MEIPSTTNSKAHEDQHKNPTPSNDQLPTSDHHHRHHQPLINISCKLTPHQDNNSPYPTTRATWQMENARAEQETGPENGLVGREKLMRYWKEVNNGGASTIVVPERWGQEDLLKDWIDCSSFDALLAPKGVGLARENLVAEARRRGRARGVPCLN